MQNNPIPEDIIINNINKIYVSFSLIWDVEFSSCNSLSLHIYTYMYVCVYIHIYIC